MNPSGRVERDRSLVFRSQAEAFLRVAAAEEGGGEVTIGGDVCPGFPCARGRDP
jgi:hypothetical protein